MLILTSVLVGVILMRKMYLSREVCSFQKGGGR